MRDLSLVELKALREALEAWPASRIVAPELTEKLDAELALRGWRFVVRAFENSWKPVESK
jgi:hypothetical protein